tara:strand:- start:28 stop:609 length:582 start_codon:yes stop_codon:yes gene_type:complete
MAAIAVAGVGLMVMCSSSSVAAMMMGGGGDDDSSGADTTPKTPKTPVVPTLPSGQYVKLVHTNVPTDTVINLAELEVFAKAGTTNLAAGKTVTSSAFHPAGPLPHLVDGVMTNFAHTYNEIAATGDSMLIDLGSVQEIEKIKITNRVDCCQERAIGIKVVILGADGTTVVKETPAITTNAATYTFTFPGTAWV